ncbi:hypothetical protein [Nostoc sp.]|uniref:hypothetical protein n=1 Tax=Nostoc sp. TaxID=1180 RepID=UPI002FFB7D69
MPFQKVGDKVPVATHLRELAKDFKGKQIREVKSRVWSLESGVWSLEFGVWSLEFGVWSSEWGF